ASQSSTGGGTSGIGGAASGTGGVASGTGAGSSAMATGTMATTSSTGIGTGGGSNSSTSSGLPACPPVQKGDYCRKSPGSCLPCSSTTYFDFGTPRKLTGIDRGQGVRFPRTKHSTGEMLFRTVESGDTRILLTTDYMSDPGTDLDTNVNAQGDDQDGPLDA